MIIYNKITKGANKQLEKEKHTGNRKQWDVHIHNGKSFYDLHGGQRRDKILARSHFQCHVTFPRPRWWEEALILPSQKYPEP